MKARQTPRAVPGGRKLVEARAAAELEEIALERDRYRLLLDKTQSQRERVFQRELTACAHARVEAEKRAAVAADALRVAAAEVTNLKVARDSWRASALRVGGDNERLRAENASQKEEISGMWYARRDAENERDALKRENTRLSAELAGARATLAEWGATDKEAQAIDRLAAENTRLTATCAAMLEEEDKRRAVADALAAENTRLQEEVARLRTAAPLAGMQFAAQCEEQSRLRTENTRLRGEVERGSNALRDAADAMGTAVSHLELESLENSAAYDVLEAGERRARGASKALAQPPASDNSTSCQLAPLLDRDTLKLLHFSDCGRQYLAGDGGCDCLRRLEAMDDRAGTTSSRNADAAGK